MFINDDSFFSLLFSYIHIFAFMDYGFSIGEFCLVVYQLILLSYIVVLVAVSK